MTGSLPSADDLRMRCEGRTEAMVALLEELVEQNSHSYYPEGGRLVADMLRRELVTIPGVEVTLVPSDHFAPHVVVTTAAAADSAEGAVALVGHLDTVFPVGTFEGFSVEGDIARGPGVLDMKGGLVVAIEALRLLADLGGLEDLPVRFVIVSDEEIGSPEGGPLLEARLAGAACALVFEAGRSGDAIITARKGTGGIVAVAEGKAAHAGNHHAEGANAIWALAKLIDEAQRLTDYTAGVTVSVGLISGGTSRNTVPARAEATFDLRFITTEDGHAVTERIQEAAKRAAQAVPGTRITIDGGVKRPPLERCAENIALYREYAACALEAGLGGPEAPLIGGGSDASTVAAIGIPAIDGLGPRGSGFHTHDELIEISSLAMRLEALVRFLWGRRRPVAKV
ncbi:MAG: M20 family metallopeptidase [Polyangiaceae bacterium]